MNIPVLTPLLGAILVCLNVPRYNELLVSWYEVAESLEALEQVLADKPVSKA